MAAAIHNLASPLLATTHPGSGEDVGRPPPVPPDNLKPKISYKNILISHKSVENEGNTSSEFWSDLEGEDDTMYDSNGTDQKGKRPKNIPPWNPDEIEIKEEEGRIEIQVAETVVKRLAKPWRFSAVIKLFGRYIGYRTLDNRLPNLWKTTGDLQIIDLENNYYLVKFANEEDWLRATLEGPWTLLGAYLVVQPWTPKFDVEQDAINSIIAWVRFPNLPIIWYDKHMLELLGNQIGETVKIDWNTSQANRGKFARIAVKLDLDKPLRDSFWLNGKLYRVAYEGLPTICLKCGRAGHEKEGCSFHVEKENEPEKTEQFGEWMKVKQNRRRPIRQDTASTELQGSFNGTRFDALSTENEEMGEANKTNNKEKQVAKETETQQTQPIKFTSTKQVEAGNHSGRQRGNTQAGQIKRGNNQGLKENPGTLVTVGPLIHGAIKENVKKPINRNSQTKIPRTRIAQKGATSPNTNLIILTRQGAKELKNTDCSEVTGTKARKNLAIDFDGLGKRKTGEIIHVEADPWPSGIRGETPPIQNHDLANSSSEAGSKVSSSKLVGVAIVAEMIHTEEPEAHMVEEHERGAVEFEAAMAEELIPPSEEMEQS